MTDCSQQVKHLDGGKLWLLLGFQSSPTCEPYTTGESVLVCFSLLGASALISV